MTDKTIDTIRVGLITRAVGVRGETAVKPLTDDSKRFRALEQKTVYIETSEAARGIPCVNGMSRRVGFVSAVISGVRFHKDQVIVKFDFCADAETANSLRGKYISITSDMLIPLDEGSYYVFDLIGCRVVNTDGAKMGTLCDVLETGGNDVYVVKRSVELPLLGGEGNEILLPAIKSVIVRVDITNKLVVADMSMYNSH